MNSIHQMLLDFSEKMVDSQLLTSIGIFDAWLLE